MALIEVFADVCCPFTHLGLRRLIEQRRLLRRDEPRLLVRAWPLELVNGTPLDADFVSEEVDELRRQVAPDLFRGFDPSSFPSTSLPAFATAAAAYQRSLASGEALSLAIRSALFEEGRNIADPKVLADIARRHSLPPAEEEDQRRAFEDMREGQARGVIGSPHFFLTTGSVFCPTLRITRDDGHLRITIDEESMQNFFGEALNP